MNSHHKVDPALAALRDTLLTCGLLWLLLVGCTEPPPLRLTAKQREEVDSMYIDSVKGLAEEMDKQCSLRFVYELPRLVDSIVEVRRAEEARLREKYSRE